MLKMKVGFVNIFGRPNAGKSTLLNALLGEKLAIVSHKVQTTRHRIKGILTTKDYQIIFSDTPGRLKLRAFASAFSRAPSLKNRSHLHNFCFTGSCVPLQSTVYSCFS